MSTRRWPPLPPPSHATTTSRIFSVVALLLLFFLTMATPIQAQWLDPEPPPTPSPTSTTLSPTPSPSTPIDPALVADITPQVSLVENILASDVPEELENDQTLLDFLMQWEWHRLLAQNETGTDSGSTGISSSSNSANATAAASTIPTPFLMCAEGGRAAVERMLSNLPSAPAPTTNGTTATTRQAADGSSTTTSTPTGAAAPALPFFAQDNLTCYVVQGLAADMLKQTTSVEPVKYSAPIPTSLKLARGLFTRMSNGALMVNADACAAGIRVILAPGKDFDAEAAATFVASVKNELVTGAFHDNLMTTFAFANRTFVEEAAGISSNSTAAAALRMKDAAAASVKTAVEMMDSMEEKEKEATTVDITTTSTTGSNARLRRQGKFLRKGRELVNVATSTTTTKAATTTTTRAEKWWRKMAPVLRGDVTCDWSGVALTAHLPFLRLDGYCGMVPSPATNVANATACLTVLVAFLASQPEVLFLEAFPVIRRFDAVAGSVMQTGLKDDTPVWDSGLDGSGQIIQVADTGLDFKHCMFNDATGNIKSTTWDVGAFDLTRRKVVQYVAWTDTLDPAGGHGTHVSGIVAGRCVNTSAELTKFNTNYQGIAYNAKIAFYDGGNAAGALSFPASMRSKLFAPGYKAGARVYTNSWGSSSNGYTYMDSEFDGFMYENPEALVISAAGNSGLNGKNTVFSPSLSKNAISVGASQSLRNPGFEVDNVAFFSSQGPSRDGRIKPDIVAPGSVLVSANASSGLSDASCSFVGKQGTSMATPVVSSAAALIRQYFMEGRYPTGVKVAAHAFVPTGALVKSMIINSAVPMARYLIKDGSPITLGLPPDNYQGFGRVKLEDVLNLVPLNPISLYVKDAVPLAEGQVHTYKFSIPSTATAAAVTPFKVTLTWTDPYVLATAAKLVLHDLDLSLRTSKADVLFYANERTSGPDSLNSVEKIAMYTPTAGDVYTVLVNGTSISTAPLQNYALVASGISFIPAAWYCQDPRVGRIDASYRTEYCKLTCIGAAFTTNPICCASHAGATCNSTADADALSSLCEAAAKPAGCVPPTKAPTRAPSSSPTKAPTKAPTKTPTRTPSKAPTKRPSSSPSSNLSPSGAPTEAPPTPPPLNTSTLDAGEEATDATAGAVASDSFSRWGLVLCVCMSMYLILL